MSPAGDTWIEETELHYIDEEESERFVEGTSLGLAGPKDDYDKQELYTGGFVFLQGWNAGSQTFTPEEDYVATRLSLMLSRWEVTRKGPFIVKLTIVGGSCWAETVLWSEVRGSQSLPLVDESGEWQDYDLPSLPLSKDVVYRIVIHTVPGWYWWNGSEWVVNEAVASMKAWGENGSNPYLRGSAWTGCNFRDGSGSWSNLPNDDFAFIVWKAIAGYIWIEETKLHYIDKLSYERSIEGGLV